VSSPDERPALDGTATSDRFRKMFLLGLTGLISLVFLLMVRHFLLAVLLAAVFSAMARPLFQRLERALGGRKRLTSLVTLLALVLVLVAPTVAFFGIVAKEAVQISQAAAPWIERQISDVDRIDHLLEHVPLIDRIPALHRLVPNSEQIASKAGEAASKIGSFMVNGLTNVTRGTVAFFFQLSIMLYSMYFFLKDGDAILKRILYYVPLSAVDEARLLEKFVSVSRATLKGSILIGIMQGTVTGLGFWATGVPGAAFWGTVTIVVSIIPAIGAVLVWGPAVVYLMVTGHMGAGVALLAWCGLVVSTLDNFVRPILVGHDTKMSDLMILLSTLGGIFLFGVVGFIVGPIVAALFVTVWHLYGEAFHEMLPGEPPPEPEY